MHMALSYFKALSDETRLRLVYILLHYELSVNELVRILDMGQSRVSRHLKILAEAGLLVSRRDGLWVFYAAPRTGESSDFLHAVMPFVHSRAIFAADMHMAAQILEERALKTCQFFNAIAEDWDELNREVIGSFDLPAAVCAAMSGHCDVAVDLGCGTGAVLVRMLSRSENVIGVDGSARMLDICRRRFRPEDVDGGRVSLRIGELSHLPLRDGEAYFASINLVLHHLSDPLASLMEIRRVLKPGGRIFVADFERHANESMRSRYGDRWLGFDEDILTTYLVNAGFAEVRCSKKAVEQGMTLLLLDAVAS
ncbi:MAG: metalloregulator ArsR/SmtB family transcription factor [Desulfovibrio sp.]|nr:metalloregulator ArsR/SmtB family transcription factor [Desulfovibrio sp.]